MVRVELRHYVPNKSGRFPSKQKEHYYVEVMVYEQEMWDCLRHAAMIADRKTAENLRAAVEKAVRAAQSGTSDAEKGTFFGLDLAHWIWSPSASIPWTILQKKPTAIPYNYEEMVAAAKADAAIYAREERGPGAR